MFEKPKMKELFLVVKLFYPFPCIFHRTMGFSIFEKIFLFEIKPIHCFSGFKMQFSVFRNKNFLMCDIFRFFPYPLEYIEIVEEYSSEYSVYYWDKIIYLWLHYVENSIFFIFQNGIYSFCYSDSVAHIFVTMFVQCTYPTFLFTKMSWDYTDTFNGRMYTFIHRIIICNWVFYN